MGGPKNILRAPERSAAPSIRGYFYQFLQTVRTWIALEPSEFLWCEGNEDLDAQLADGSWAEIQLKDLDGAVTEATESVQKLILNFLCGFIAHKKKGSRVRFVLRTTANLGNARDPRLAPWLRGEDFELSQLVAALQRLVEKSDNEAAKVAMKELLSHSEEKAFFDAVSWEFGQCEHDALLAELQSCLTADKRFSGVDPIVLAERLIAKIAATSCAEPLSTRVLTRRDLDFLVNDLQISSRCRTFNYGPDEQENLYVGTAVGKDICAVVVRYGNANDAKLYLESAITEATHHPMATASDASIWDSHLIDNSLLKLDADLFGAISGGRSFKALLKSLSFAARLAKVRGGEDAILICDPNITLGIDPPTGEIDQQLDDALSEFELEASDRDVRQQLADRFAHWVLKRDDRANQFSRKVRCFADFRNDAYFTQQSQAFLVDLLAD